MNPNDPICKAGDDFKFGGLATGGYSPGQEPPIRGSARTEGNEPSGMDELRLGLRFEREARMNAEEEVREARELLRRWVEAEGAYQLYLVRDTEAFLS